MTTPTTCRHDFGTWIGPEGELHCCYCGDELASAAVIAQAKAATAARANIAAGRMLPGIGGSPTKRTAPRWYVVYTREDDHRGGRQVTGRHGPFSLRWQAEQQLAEARAEGLYLEEKFGDLRLELERYTVKGELPRVGDHRPYPEVDEPAGPELDPDELPF